jgi:hypothetical protein
MLFHFNKNCNLVKPKIVFGNLEINYISGVKLLGINISNNLQWNNHIQSLGSKLNKVFYMITSLIGEQFIYVKIYIFCKILAFNKVWYNFMERGNWECTDTKDTKIGCFLHIKILIKESCRRIFKELEIFKVTMLCIFAVLCYLKKNWEGISIWMSTIWEENVICMF